MLSAPDLYIACPHCRAVARIFEVAEANFFAAITWTDGFQDVPMTPRAPRITRCLECARIFWTGEATPLGYLHGTGDVAPEKVAWTNAPYLAPLDEQGVMEALGTGLALAPELELELRILMWWRGNDAFRIDEAPVGYPRRGDAIANMERFIEMTYGGDEDLLLFRAEALRQLGRFAEVEETLKGVGCSDYWPAKSRQLELIRGGDRKLRKLFASQLPKAPELIQPAT